MLLALALALGLLYRQRPAPLRHTWVLALMPGWVLLQQLPPLLPWHDAASLVLGGLCALCALWPMLRGHEFWALWLRRAAATQALLLVPLSALWAAQRTLPLWAALLGAELVLAWAWALLVRRTQAFPSLELAQGEGRSAVWWGLASAWLVALVALLLLPWLGWVSALLVPVSLLMVGYLHVHSFGLALRSAALEAHEAELRLQERMAELDRHYNQLAETKLEQVTERERKRIAADLHDDLGAKLLTIVHTSDSERISSLAREALEEMRLSVRGLTGKPVQLLDALGDWRAELVSRLAQANILAEWKSPAEEVEHTLPARAYVQTTRILREAVSNIIKHSGATHCVVSCTVQDGYFGVVIQDNGQGIPMELDGRLDKGHGMASMKSRAKQMHGQCLVESGPGWGTVIRLTIPL